MLMLERKRWFPISINIQLNNNENDGGVFNPSDPIAIILIDLFYLLRILLCCLLFPCLISSILSFVESERVVCLNFPLFPSFNWSDFWNCVRVQPRSWPERQRPLILQLFEFWVSQCIWFKFIKPFWAQDLTGL